MVCDRNGLMSPINSTLDIFFHMGNTIHTAHLCMQMKLHAFFFGIINTGRRRRCSHDVFRHDIDFFAVFIKLNITLHTKIFAFFDLIAQFLIKNTSFYKEFDSCGIAQVSNIKGNNIFFAFDFLCLHIINTAFNNNSFPFNFCINHFDRIAIDFFAQKDPFRNSGSNCCDFCICFFLYSLCLGADNFLAEFHQTLFLFLFSEGSFLRSCLYIFKLNHQVSTRFFRNHMHQHIIQMFLCQIICHIIFHINQHLTISDFPFGIRNNTCTYLALLTDESFDAIPVPSRQFFCSLFIQFICNVNIYFTNTRQTFQKFLFEVFSFLQRDQFLCRNFHADGSFFLMNRQSAYFCSGESLLYSHR